MLRHMRSFFGTKKVAVARVDPRDEKIEEESRRVKEAREELQRELSKMMERTARNDR